MKKHFCPWCGEEIKATSKGIFSVWNYHRTKGFCNAVCNHCGQFFFYTNKPKSIIKYLIENIVAILGVCLIVVLAIMDLSTNGLTSLTSLLVKVIPALIIVLAANHIFGFYIKTVLGIYARKDSLYRRESKTCPFTYNFYAKLEFDRDLKNIMVDNCIYKARFDVKNSKLGTRQHPIVFDNVGVTSKNTAVCRAGFVCELDAPYKELKEGMTFELSDGEIVFAKGVITELFEPIKVLPQP